MYLGLPLGGYPKQLSLWQPIIDKAYLKLDRWKRYNLSREGCLTLCNVVLANLPTYSMSIFQMPNSVISKSERIMYSFFWEGQKGSKLNHLVKWEIASKALQDGGLGVGNLKTRNLVLLFKWNWRSLKNRKPFGVK